MNWQVWKDVEAILIELGIAPVLAVVPDNRDDNLCVEAAVPYFWDVVRGWQARGWTIGIHGYQHLYVTQDGGILGINQQSEFAGLSHDEQYRKLCAAVDIFRRERVLPEVWIAPSHSFDLVTLQILRELGIDAVSDGFFVWPHKDKIGTKWVPQQLWRFRKFPTGVWTVCCHVNSWTSRQVVQFRHDLITFHDRIADFPSILQSAASRERGILDSMLSTVHPSALKIRRVVARYKARGRVPA